jgi:hypothetical protein
MFISKNDLELLREIEVYLWNNKNMDLYLKLFELNEKLIIQREKTNKANWERIKTKREIDKNYARSTKEKNEKESDK